MDIREVMRDTRVEIDIEKLRHNYRALKGYLKPGTEIAAVVKANGYGHDAVEVGKVFWTEGAKYLAVANFSEGMELRRASDEYRILVMGYTQDNQLKAAVGAGLTLTIFDYEQGILIDEYAGEQGIETEVHLKINTGFNRLGFTGTDRSIEDIQKLLTLTNIQVRGIFTHLALTNKVEDEVQYRRFEEFLKRLKEKGIEIECEHICDSLGAIRYPDYHMGMVRAGAILYGYYNGESPIELKPAMEYRSRISAVNSVEEGRGVSYDYMYRVEKDSRIAVIPMGYADGYPRNLWKTGEVVVEGKRVPIAGIICMDQLMIDITEAEGAGRGSEVVLWGEDLPLEEVAKKAGTNKNDLIASVSRRVPRVYLDGGEVVRIKDYLLGEWEK